MSLLGKQALDSDVIKIGCNSTPEVNLCGNVLLTKKLSPELDVTTGDNVTLLIKIVSEIHTRVFSMVTV